MRGEGIWRLRGGVESCGGVRGDEMELYEVTIDDKAALHKCGS